MDTYERTYSQLLEAEQLANDRAIAAALTEENGPRPPQPDTSLDGQLALQLHEKEVEKLVRPPSVTRKSHRKRKALHSLLQTLNVTRLVPRPNPAFHLTESYVSQDRQRLLLRLEMYALQERRVNGDGNCQFRAVADQLWCNQERHLEVRQAAVSQLCQQPQRYRDYVTTAYQQYVSSMSSPGTWGDHITLQAAADAFQVRICIVSSFLDNCIISINPTGQQEQQQQQQPAQQGVPGQLSPGRAYNERTLWLSFWAEVHYNSLSVKAPESPSGVSASSDEGSSGGNSSDTGGGGGGGGSSRKQKLLGSKKLRHAADALLGYS